MRSEDTFFTERRMQISTICRRRLRFTPAQRTEIYEENKRLLAALFRLIVVALGLGDCIG